MANSARGEISITVKGVGEVALCLTLAGMTHIESFFEVENLEAALSKIGDNPSSRTIANMLHALTLGGTKPFSVDAIQKWPITIAEINDAMRALNSANSAAVGNEPVPQVGNRAARRAKAKA